MLLPSVPHLRDLTDGPCLGIGGRRMRPRAVFRSGVFGGLDADGLARVSTLAIGMRCDLRGTEEQARTPFHIPGAIPRASSTPTPAAPPGAVDAGNWRARIKDPRFDAEAAQAWILKAYMAMPAMFAAPLCGLFGLLAGSQPPPATLIHCTAGKDRTGFVAALLWLALGAEREAVLQDYLEAGRARDTTTLLLELLGPDLSAAGPGTRAALERVAGVEPEWLETAFRSIERDHGGIDGYLRDACRLDLVRRDRLRANLLAGE